MYQQSVAINNRLSLIICYLYFGSTISYRHVYSLYLYLKLKRHILIAAAKTSKCLNFSLIECCCVVCLTMYLPSGDSFADRSIYHTISDINFFIFKYNTLTTLLNYVTTLNRRFLMHSNQEYKIQYTRILLWVYHIIFSSDRNIVKPWHETFFHQIIWFWKHRYKQNFVHKSHNTIKGLRIKL